MTIIVDQSKASNAQRRSGRGQNVQYQKRCIAQFLSRLANVIHAEREG